MYDNIGIYQNMNFGKKVALDYKRFWSYFDKTFMYNLIIAWARGYGTLTNPRQTNTRQTLQTLERQTLDTTNIYHNKSVTLQRFVM